MQKYHISRLVGVVAVVLVGLGLFMALPLVRAGGDTLFEDLPGEVAVSDTAVSRAKQVAANWRVLQNPETPRIILNLFDGELITAVHERTERSPALDGFVWVGHVPEQEGSYVTLSVSGDALTGHIVLAGGRQFIITPDGRSQLLQEIDTRRAQEVPGWNDTLDPPPFAPDAANEAAMCADGSRVDLLLAYTTAARNAQGGKAAIEALLHERVAEMNIANQASGLAMRFRLAHVMEIAYRETGDVSTDLERLRTGASGLKPVLTARNTYQADIAGLVIAEAKQDNSCGIAYVMKTPSLSFSEWAFNVTALDYAGMFTCNMALMTHSIGHNMGNDHEPATAAGNPVYPYSHGYQAPNKAFRTLMAYPCSGVSCPQINHWSNPNVRYNGAPTGNKTTADNARSMGQTAQYVANFRENCASEPTSTPATPPTAQPTSTAVPTSQPGSTPTPTATAMYIAPPPAGWQAALPVVVHGR